MPVTITAFANPYIAPAPPVIPVQVRVGYLPATHDTLLFVAKKLDFFDKSRIQVVALSYSNSVEILNDLKSNNLDIGIPGIATPALEIGGNAELSIIGGAAAESAALVAGEKLVNELKGKDIKSKIILLKGKKVGAVRGSTGLAIFRQALHDSGVDEKDLDLRDYKKPAEIISALAIGDLDAGLLWSPHMTLAIDNHKDKGFDIAIWMTEVLSEHVCCRQVARDEFQNNNPDAVVEYLVGILRAAQYMKQAQGDPQKEEEVKKAVRDYFPTLTDKQIDTELFEKKDLDKHLPRTTLSPDLNPEGIKKYLKAMENSKLMRLDQCRNVEAKINTTFLTEAFQRLAALSGHHTCREEIAKACIDKPALECECLQNNN